MKPIAIAVVALFFAIFPANSQDSHPEIVGVWEILSGQVLTYEGTILPLSEMPEGEIEIEAQEGPLFRGVYRWHHPEGTNLNDGLADTNQAEEPFLGVFAGDGRTFIMVDTPDSGYWFGLLLDNGEMELRYAESGPRSAVGFSILRRKK